MSTHLKQDHAKREQECRLMTEKATEPNIKAFHETLAIMHREKAAELDPE